MKPAAFEYRRPETVEEALQLLAQHGADAKVIAGGQSLVPLMNFRLARPAVLVDLNGLGELSFLGEQDGRLALGALLRHSTIEDSELVSARCPLLTAATRLIGHRTVRNRGTLGGSIAHADPSAEHPAVLAALDGQVVARSASGERVIPARELFVTVCTTALEPTELLTEVRLPLLAPGTGWAFEELSRRHGDWAVVGVAVVLSLDRTGRFSDVRIALAGVGRTPLRCGGAETALVGQRPSAEAIGEACSKCSAEAEPEDDIHSTASYKKAMIGVFVERALHRALERAEGS